MNKLLLLWVFGQSCRNFGIVHDSSSVTKFDKDQAAFNIRLQRKSVCRWRAFWRQNCVTTLDDLTRSNIEQLWLSVFCDVVNVFCLRRSYVCKWIFKIFSQILHYLRPTLNYCRVLRVYFLNINIFPKQKRKIRGFYIRKSCYKGHVFKYLQYTSVEENW